MLKSIPPTPAEQLQANDGKDTHGTQTLTWAKRCTRLSEGETSWMEPGNGWKEGAYWECPARLPAFHLDLLGHSSRKFPACPSITPHAMVNIPNQQKTQPTRRQATHKLTAR